MGNVCVNPDAEADRKEIFKFSPEDTNIPTEEMNSKNTNAGGEVPIDSMIPNKYNYETLKSKVPVRNYDNELPKEPKDNYLEAKRRSYKDIPEDNYLIPVRETYPVKTYEDIPKGNYLFLGKPKVEEPKVDLEELIGRIKKRNDLPIDKDIPQDELKNLFPSEGSALDLYVDQKEGFYTGDLDDTKTLVVFRGKFKTVDGKNIKDGLGEEFNVNRFRKGTWVDDKFVIGKEANSKNQVMFGQYKDDYLNGKGYLNHNDECIYKGDFVNGKRDGQGELKTKDFTYNGHFEKGKMDGKGDYKFVNGITYEGEVKTNKFEGKGKITYIEGGYYEGQFVNDQFHGQGTLELKDGQVYTGDFVNGVKEGKGKMTFSDGKEYEGDFKDGNFNGEGELTYKDRKIVRGSFINGKPDDAMLIDPINNVSKKVEYNQKRNSLLLIE